MTEIFLYIVNMSITATILAVVVLFLRLLLKKAPKWISVLLWGLVALRLICPFAVESPFSLIPKTDWVVQEPLTEENFFLDSVPDTIPAFDSSSFGSDVTVQYSYYPLENSNIEIHRGISISFILSCIWAAGMAALLLHTGISTIRLRKSIGAAIRIQDNVWESSAVESPFVLGMIRPRIYVPRGMSEEKLAYVIAHEKAHICRKDHWWKPLGFLLLTIHWFNPVLWLAYILLCRDIEMACDERVIKEYDDVQRADYSEALLDCSVKRKMITACPLAFGEVSVKERIKSVLHYKKPAFWIVVLAVIACVVTAACFLTNPLTVRNPWVREYVVGAEGILGQVDKEKYESVSEYFSIGADKYGRAVFKDPFTAFDTMKELYSEGLTLIAEEQDLSPISHRNYNLYKKFGWQVTTGTEEAQRQAKFVTNFLDIYENSFDKQKPNTDLPAPTVEGENSTGNVLASNISEEILSYEELKKQQEEIWAMRNAVASAEIILEYQKKFASVACNPGENYVTVFVKDFTEEDILRFEKKFGHFSYILVSADEYAETMPELKANLTLDDVITLSAKGEDLTWSDFEQFQYTETGSGLYIRVYEIDETFSVWIGDGKLTGIPMYIRLKLNDGDAYADVTKDDVATFIATHGALFGNPRSYYTDIAWPAALSAAAKENIRLDKDRFVNIRHGYDGQTIWVQFPGITDDGWDDRSVEVTLVRGGDGEYSVMEEGIYIISQQEIQKNLAISQIQNDIRCLEEIIEANPEKYAMDIPRDSNAYENIFRYGDALVLEYIFSEFLAGEQTDLHGFVLWQVMIDCLNENEKIAYDAENGQDYFDHWLESARSVGEQHDSAWLQENVPAIALILSMAGE